MFLRHLLSIQKKEIIDKLYVKKLLFNVSMCWIHNFQDKPSTLNFLSSALRAFVNISLYICHFDKNNLTTNHWVILQKTNKNTWFYDG